MREETIMLKVGNIAAMTSLKLTIDHNMGGYVLYEGIDTGGVSDSKFGSRRRTYGEFIDWLDAVTLGLVLGQDQYVS